MPAYKLTYFDLKGRGELCRLLFAAAGVEYEDKRIEQPNWPALKDGKAEKKLLFPVGIILFNFTDTVV